MFVSAESIFRICGYPLCGMPIESDRARHAKYCKRHGGAERAKQRRVYNGDRPVREWRAANKELLRLRTRIYVRQFRARKKLERELAQGIPQGALTR